METIKILQEKATNPKEFWKCLQKIDKSNTVNTNSNSPSQDEWLQHFTSLNSLDPSGIKPVNEGVNKIIQEVETKLSSPSEPPSPLMKEMDTNEIIQI